MSCNILQYFEKLSKSNKIGHAFLIGNIDLSDVKNQLDTIFSKYFFNTTHNLEGNPDVIVINSDNNQITKKQILEIQEKISTKAQVSNCKIYIINGAEFLNASAANSMLKLLEEPEKNIFAFLISNNIARVIETIKSRCQIIFVSNIIKNIYNDYDEELIESAIKFIEFIEKYNINSIAHLNEIFVKIPEKEYLKKMFIIVEYFYSDCLKAIFDLKIEYFLNEQDLLKQICSKNTYEQLIKKIDIMNKAIDKINNNLNTSLIFDKIFIDLKEVK